MTFYQLLILDCFSSEESMRTSTLYHLLKGKRTSSILSYGYFYQCLMYFALFPKIEEKNYQHIIDDLLEKKLVLEVEPGFVVLTITGRELLSASSFPKRDYLNQLAFYKWDMSYFERIVFTTQVLSEKAHHNVNYLPIENSLFKQQQLKNWLRKQNKEVTSDFYLEWDQLTDDLPKESQELILGQLVGFNEIGLTLNQLADKNKQDYLFNYLEFKNIWHHLIQLIIEKPKQYPLFDELLQIEINSKKEDSSQLSGQLSQEGLSIEEIAKKRGLKISTVTDHLIEEYILTQDQKKIPAFSEELKKALRILQNSEPQYLKWTYQEALNYYPDISFYEFRFYQFYLIKKERSK